MATCCSPAPLSVLFFSPTVCSLAVFMGSSRSSLQLSFWKAEQIRDSLWSPPSQQGCSVPVPQQIHPPGASSPSPCTFQGKFILLEPPALAVRTFAAGGVCCLPPPHADVTKHLVSLHSWASPFSAEPSCSWGDTKPGGTLTMNYFC